MDVSIKQNNYRYLDKSYLTRPYLISLMTCVGDMMDNVTCCSLTNGCESSEDRYRCVKLAMEVK